MFTTTCDPSSGTPVRCSRRAFAGFDPPAVAATVERGSRLAVNR